jgi:hypothetical protein
MRGVRVPVHTLRQLRDDYPGASMQAQAPYYSYNASCMRDQEEHTKSTAVALMARCATSNNDTSSNHDTRTHDELEYSGAMLSRSDSM